MRLLIALAAVLFLSGGAQAYSHSFVNKGKNTVHFWMNYKMCSNDSWDVKPGETITWRSGLCCALTPKIELGGKEYAGHDPEKGKPTVPMVGPGGTVYPAGGATTYCNNTNWKYEWRNNNHYLEMY